MDLRRYLTGQRPPAPVPPVRMDRGLAYLLGRTRDLLGRAAELENLREAQASLTGEAAGLAATEVSGLEASLPAEASRLSDELWAYVATPCAEPLRDEALIDLAHVGLGALARPEGADLEAALVAYEAINRALREGCS